MFLLKHRVYDSLCIESSYDYWAIYKEDKLVLTTRDKKIAEARLKQLNEALANKSR
jgi:hypothetical protein